MRPQQYAIASIVASTLLVAGSQFAKGETPSVRVFIGGTIAAVALSVIAGPLPSVAVGLATLAILAAVLRNGYDLARPLISVVTG